MKWQMRVAKLAILGRIPFGETFRRVKRRMFGYAPDHDNLVATVHNFGEIEAAVLHAGGTFAGATVLEIGTGWFPVVPILLPSVAPSAYCSRI